MTNIFKSVILTSLIFVSHFTAAADGNFRVVVNPSNTTTVVEQKVLADIFLKKMTFWPGAKSIYPVDLEAESRVRRQFSEEILDRPVAAVRNYWQQLIFSGRGVPPPEMNGEQEVIKFISSHPDAIGYVSADADVHNLKILKVK